MFWKVYFIYFVVLSLVFAGFSFFFIFSGQFDAIESYSDLLSFISIPFGILAMRGFVANKKFLFQKFWILFLVVSVANELIYGGAGLLDFLSEPEVGTAIKFSMLILFLSLLPYYYALYSYSVNKEFWYAKFR